MTTEEWGWRWGWGIQTLQHGPVIPALETEGISQVQDQPGLHAKTLPHNKSNKSSSLYFTCKEDKPKNKKTPFWHTELLEKCPV